MRVLVLGAGFGGLELTTRLSEAFGDDVDVVLIDQSYGFMFGISKLDVMFGRALPSAVRHPYRDFVKPGVRFVQATVRSIDPVAKRLVTDAGTFDADILVVGLGADLRPGPPRRGWLRGVTSSTRWRGLRAPRRVGTFRGRPRDRRCHVDAVQVPPAPSETALLMDDYLTQRGLRDSSHISLLMPMGIPIPPSPAESEALLVAFAERGIDWHAEGLVRALEPACKVAILSDGSDMPYDLFLGVPVHRAPAVVEESGMTVDGWIPVNRLTLETAFPGVYAVGDVTSVGTPKAGVFRRRTGSSGRRRNQYAHSRHHGVSAVRRSRDVLPGVRPRPGCAR
jgi:sulfide:quinone oxidoreductase